MAKIVLQFWSQVIPMDKDTVTIPILGILVLVPPPILVRMQFILPPNFLKSVFYSRKFTDFSFLLFQ